MRISSLNLRRSMSWRRLPSYLANIRLRLMPFNEQQIKAYEETGHVKQIAFKTTPRVGKVGGPPSARPERIQGHGMIMQVFPTEQQPVL